MLEFIHQNIFINSVLIQYLFIYLAMEDTHESKHKNLYRNKKL